MDVRCEKCGTEYELDDARLKPSGVTVKCTSCDHVFRVRRHSITTAGVGTGIEIDEPPPGTKRPDTMREDALPEGHGATEVERTSRSVPGSDTIPVTPVDADGASTPRAIRLTPSSARAHARRGRERNWLVRLPSGDIETCRELATLHQWIISGKVSRISGISRTGKTWKRLGDIKELSSFFDAAAEMRRARRAGQEPQEPAAAPDEVSSGPPEPIPDSFSASGPVAAESSGPVSASAPEPARSDPAAERSGPAQVSEVKRTLLGVPTAPVRARAASYQRAAARDSTEEAEAASASGSEAAPEPAPGEAPAPLPDLSGHHDDEDTVQAEPVFTPAAGPGEDPAEAGAAQDARAPDVAATWKPSMQLRDPAVARPEAQHAGAPGGDDADTRVDMPEGLAGGQAQSQAEERLESQAEERLESEAEIHIEHGPEDTPDSRADSRTEERLESEADIQIEYGSSDTTEGGSDAEDRTEDEDMSAGEDTPSSGEATGAPDESASSGLRLGSRTGMARIAALDERRGPSAGLTRGVAADDVAFAGSRIRPLPEDADSDELSEDEPVAASGGGGRWFVLVALVLMAASAAVIYMLVFRPPDEQLGIVVGALDASPEELALTEPADPETGLDPEDIGAEVRAALAADTRAGLEALRTRLATVDERSDWVLAARARVRTALAQQLVDRAELVDREESAALRRQADTQVLDALTLAQRALQANRDAPAALVAMADVQRMQKRSTQQVESYLTRALAGERDHFDARLVRAMTQARTKRRRDDARELFEKLAAEARDTGDVRPAYRLALLDHDDGRDEDARRRAREVLALQPAHEGALALIERMDARLVVDTSDPMPPEDHGSGDEPDERAAKSTRDDQNERSDKSSKKAGGSSEETASRGQDEDSYEDLVARAGRRARAGQCGEAMELYERALDMNPSGADALTGMGRCHAERQEFASAYGKFQAALGVSPRNADAMWSMAEAYRKQGLEAQALEWYRKYVDAHPNGRRASAARRRIDELAPPPAPAEEADPPARETSPPAEQTSPPAEEPQPPAPGAGGQDPESPGAAAPEAGGASGR